MKSVTVSKVDTPASTDTPFDHALKIDPERLAEVERGEKKHEVRVFDRDYKVGQVLKLLGFDRARSEYTGRGQFVLVTCITPPGSYGLPTNVGVMSIQRMGGVPPSKDLKDSNGRP
jgi:hypothetical protein